MRVANAVARIDNLEFLADVVPRTMTYKAFKEKKAAKESMSKSETSQLTNGQRTLEQMSRPEQGQDDTDVDMNGTEDGHTPPEDTNGHAYDVEEPSSPEPGVGPSTRVGHAGQFYDAVRNGYERRSDNVPMEE